MKKLIAFDLDGTLAPSKSALLDEMAEVFRELLSKHTVCVISGGRFEQFEMQLINNLHADGELLHQLHIMPTCGTRYMRYDSVEDKWVERYAENIPEKDKKRIIKALLDSAEKLGILEKKVYGEIIEDRGTQITFSGLGQEIVTMLGVEGLRMKEAWDPDDKKKRALRDEAADLLPDYEVRVGGISSVDVTRPGIDKAYGMQKIKDELGIGDEDILFIGDRLEEGGNDFPVREMGIDTIAVKDWHETRLVIETINRLG